MECHNCVVEKTVRRAERAWFITEKEMGARPGSERSFLAGETERVFELPIGTLEYKLPRIGKCLQ